MPTACWPLVIGWHCELVRSSREEWNNSTPNYSLTSHYSPLFPTMAMGYASTLTLGLKLLSVIISEL